MGFFGRLFEWDQSLGAINAVLANYLLEFSPDYMRPKIAEEVIKYTRVYDQECLLNKFIKISIKSCGSYK